MSARSRQAQAFARDLADRTGARVSIESTGRGQWIVQWAHGPTLDQMRDVARGLLHRYPDMAGQRLEWARGWAPRAWAARAVAAHREGTLRPAVERAAAWRRECPLPGFPTDLMPEDLAQLAFVEDLINTTPDPDRAGDPADEPAIERLLAASGGSEYRMTALLLADGSHILTGELPPGVAPLRHRDT